MISAAPMEFRCHMYKVNAPGHQMLSFTMQHIATQNPHSSPHWQTQKRNAPRNCCVRGGNSFHPPSLTTNATNTKLWSCSTTEMERAQAPRRRMSAGIPGMPAILITPYHLWRDEEISSSRQIWHDAAIIRPKPQPPLSNTKGKPEQGLQFVFGFCTTNNTPMICKSKNFNTPIGMCSWGFRQFRGFIRIAT